MNKIAWPTVVATLALTTQLVAAPPADLQLATVVGGFTRPITITHAGDGSGRLFIVEQAGLIRIWDGTQLLATPFLDLTALVDDTGDEQGLLGLAFHPDYAVNGRFFVNYTYDPGAGLDRTRIARYQVSVDPNLADPTATVILEIAQDFENHNGGDLHFGRDGFLYVGMGDGGSGQDPYDRAQDLGQLLGKMLRLDVDSAPGGADCGLVGNYALPADNPFLATPGACDEIWAFGLRNPWRFSFDRATGDLFIGDVGQFSWEEVDHQPAATARGETKGRSCTEGDTTVNYNPCLAGDLTAPIAVYGHALGCAVTGGYRFRGHTVPGLEGTYVYGDYCSGRIWFATDAGATWSVSQWLDTGHLIVAFGEDEQGELYLASLAGTVYRFASPSAVFAADFEVSTLAGWSLTTP